MGVDTVDLKGDVHVGMYVPRIKVCLSCGIDWLKGKCGCGWVVRVLYMCGCMGLDVKGIMGWGCTTSRTCYPPIQIH